MDFGLDQMNINQFWDITINKGRVFFDNLVSGDFVNDNYISAYLRLLKLNSLKWKRA